MLTDGTIHTTSNAWEMLDSDERSPVHRLYRLQSLLCTISLALQSPHLPPSEMTEHLRVVVEQAYSESEHIGGDLETWLNPIKIHRPT